MKKIFYTTIYILLSWGAFGQSGNEVNITILLSQPYSPYLSDYLELENQAVVQLQNLTNNSIDVKLVGRITGANGYEVSTQLDYPIFNPTQLSPLEVKNLQAGGTDMDFFNANNLNINVPSGVQKRAIRTGILPEGNYELCLQALDPDTNVPLSIEVCVPFAISYLDPPSTISPMCDSDMNQDLPTFMWTSPVGNTVGASFRYDLYILNHTEYEDPDVIMQSAIDYQGGNLYVVRDLITSSYLWDVSDPDLQDGLYAWMVVARDENDQVFFQNDGRSNVCRFTVNFDEDIGIDVTQYSTISTSPCSMPNSGCPTSGPTDFTPVSTIGLSVGSKVRVGYFDMLIDQIDRNTGLEVDGIGLIDMPIVGFDLVNVKVQFKDLQINGNQMPELINGTVLGHRHSSETPSMVPTFGDPTGGGNNPLTIGQNLYNFLQGTQGSLLTAANQVAGGFSFPIGIELGGNTLAVTDVRFTNQSAEAKMSVFFELAEVTSNTMTNVAFSAEHVCFDATDFCGSMKLKLDSDLGINLGPIGSYTFKADNGSNNGGSHFIIEADSIKNFHIELERKFSTEVLRHPNSTDSVVARIIADGTEWDDWIGDITIDDFSIADIDDLVFRNAVGVIDHSDLKNPELFPIQKFQHHPQKYQEIQQSRWGGFWLKSLDIELPGFLSSNQQPLNLSAADMIIDDDGVSVDILAQKLISMGSVNHGEFLFSLDELGLSIIMNSFTSGYLLGQLRLPVTNSNNDQSYLNYVSTLSYSNSNPQNNPQQNNPQQNNSQQNNNNKTFSYSFIVQPKDVYVPLFLGQINLDSTTHIVINSDANGTDVAGTLNGDISITDPHGFSNTNINIPLVYFQNVGMHSDSTGFLHGGTFSHASPQKFFGGNNASLLDDKISGEAGGFPITIDQVRLKSRNENGKIGLGLAFEVGLNLTDLDIGTVSTTGGLTIWGKWENGEPAYDEVEFNSLCVQGEISVLKFKGCFKTFSKDQTYGDGFYGAVNLSVDDMFAIKTQMQFGTVSNMRYWYVDGELEFTPGITVFPGVDMYGFGGGAYYNMERTESNRTPNKYKDKDPYSNPVGVGESLSHMSYVPTTSGSSSIGFKAKVLFGMTGEKSVYNGDVTFEMTFKDGGLEYIGLDGRVKFITDDNYTEPILTVDATVQYIPEEEKFTMDAEFDVSAGIVSGNGWLNVLFQGDGMWYIKLGSPDDRINLSFLDAIQAEAYFQVGNEIDEVPPIPQFIQDILDRAGAKQGDNEVADEQVNHTDKSARRNTGAMVFNPQGISHESDPPQNYSAVSPSNLGVIAGAYASLKAGGTFLIFYGNIEAGIGFDLGLRRVNMNCDGVEVSNYADAVGLNGWFATGQLYAGIEIDLGVHIDFGFIDEKISIISAGVGAYLKMDGPNPVFAKGEVGGYFSVMGGLITGNIRYGFEWGERCAFSKDGLEGLKIISQINPDGPPNIDPKATRTVSDSVDVSVIPEFATVFAMDEFISIPIMDDDGDVKNVRIFQLKENNFNISLTGKGGQQTYMHKLMYADQYGMRLKPYATLDRETEYLLSVEVTLNECPAVQFSDGGRNSWCLTPPETWPRAMQSKNVEWKEVHKIKFTTDQGLKFLANVIGQFPLANQQFFCYKTIEPGITTGQKININSFALNISKEEAQNYDLKFTTGYTELDGGNTIYRPTSIDPSSVVGDKIIDSYPDILKPQTIYNRQLFVEWVPKNNAGQQINSRLKQETIFQQDTLYSSLASRQVAGGDINVLNRTPIYNYHFRTSRYTSIQSKIAIMEAAGTSIGCFLARKDRPDFMGYYQDGKAPVRYIEDIDLPIKQIEVSMLDQANYNHLLDILKQQLIQRYQAVGELPSGFNHNNYRVITTYEMDRYINGGERFDEVEVNYGLVGFQNSDWQDFRVELRDQLVDLFKDNNDGLGVMEQRNIGGTIIETGRLIPPNLKYTISPYNLSPPLDVENLGVSTGGMKPDNPFPSGNNDKPGGVNPASLSNVTGFSKASAVLLIKVRTEMGSGGGLSGVITWENAVLDGIIQNFVDPNPVDSNWSKLGEAADILKNSREQLNDMAQDPKLSINVGNNQYKAN